MPAYNKKITRQMNYEEFKEGIQELDDRKRAYMSVLFFAGVRVSEALALTSDDISCTADTIFVDFFRLKGSKQTDPIPLPRKDALIWLCSAEGRLFPWCRKTGYNIVRKCFDDLYPHFFRQNRFIKISENPQLGDAHVYSFAGICAQSIDHYRAKVDIKKVGRALIEEVD